MSDDTEAQEMLATEYEKDGYIERASEIRRGVGMGAPNFRAVRAINTALNHASEARAQALEEAAKKADKQAELSESSCCRIVAEYLAEEFRALANDKGDGR